MSPAEIASACASQLRRYSCGKGTSTRHVGRSHWDSRRRTTIPILRLTAEDFAEAANLFLAMHDFDLAETYFDKAKLAGANQRTVELGLTNTYLAEGDTRKAEAALASLGPVNDFRDDYDYMMASANLSRQRQDPLHALSAFAQASTVAGEQDNGIAESSQYMAADQEGRQILNDRLSIVPEASFAPVLEDINVYTLDAKILGVTNPSLLPPPRHSYQSLAESHYRVQLGNFPGDYRIRRREHDCRPVAIPEHRRGSGPQHLRHDSSMAESRPSCISDRTRSHSMAACSLRFAATRSLPVYMNQNLFRQFLYLSTSSFFNWVSVTGSAVHETGPFTEQNLHSRDDSANIEFTVGRPWGNTSLITGYSVRDLLFRPTD